MSLLLSYKYKKKFLPDKTVLQTIISNPTFPSKAMSIYWLDFVLEEVFLYTMKSTEHALSKEEN